MGGQGIVAVLSAIGPYLKAIITVLPIFGKIVSRRLKKAPPHVRQVANPLLLTGIRTGVELIKNPPSLRGKALRRGIKRVYTNF